MTVKKTNFLRNTFLFLFISFYYFSSTVTASWNFPASLVTTAMISATDNADKTSKEAAIAPVWPTTGNRNILISGGAGYIGTHTIVCLLEGKQVCRQIKNFHGLQIFSWYRMPAFIVYQMRFDIWNFRYLEGQCPYSWSHYPTLYLRKCCHYMIYSTIPIIDSIRFDSTFTYYNILCILEIVITLPMQLMIIICIYL